MVSHLQEIKTGVTQHFMMMLRKKKNKQQWHLLSEGLINLVQCFECNLKTSYVGTVESGL